MGYLVEGVITQQSFPLETVLIFVKFIGNFTSLRLPTICGIWQELANGIKVVSSGGGQDNRYTYIHRQHVLLD